jgi:hypothetical protein
MVVVVVLEVAAAAVKKVENFNILMKLIRTNLFLQMSICC